VAISIHAPVKGATGNGVLLIDEQNNFNPRTREGCDVNIVIKILDYTYFNPRTREGCDGLENLIKNTNNIISIHAPVKGAT